MADAASTPTTNAFLTRFNFSAGTSNARAVTQAEAQGTDNGSDAQDDAEEDADAEDEDGDDADEDEEVVAGYAGGSRVLGILSSGRRISGSAPNLRAHLLRLSLDASH